MARLRFMVALLVVGLISSGFLMGEDKPGEKEPIFVKAPRLPTGYSKLGLSDKQKKEIFKIRLRYAEERERLSEQLKALKGKEDTDLEKVLTKAQVERLNEVRGSGKGKETKEKPAETKEKSTGTKEKPAEIKK